MLVTLWPTGSNRDAPLGPPGCQKDRPVDLAPPVWTWHLIRCTPVRVNGRCIAKYNAGPVDPMHDAPRYLSDWDADAPAAMATGPAVPAPPNNPHGRQSNRHYRPQSVISRQIGLLQEGQKKRQNSCCHVSCSWSSKQRRKIDQSGWEGSFGEFAFVDIETWAEESVGSLVPQMEF